MKIIICGAGGVGTYITERLVQEPHDIVVIDCSEEILGKIAMRFDVQAVHGSTSEIQTLRDAGVADADVFISATNSDEANIIACLLADTLNPDLRKIARVREIVTDESSLSPRIRNVFDEFINPDVEAAHQLLRLLEVPGACEIVDLANGRIRLVGVVLAPGSALVGSPLKDIWSIGCRNMLVASVKRGGQLFIPAGDTVLLAGDIIYVVSEPENTHSIFELAGVTSLPIKSAVIWGGTVIGREIARGLSEKGVRVKLISRNKKVCQQVAGELDEVVVLHGEATDRQLLVDEGIEDADIFIGATNDEEENILAALLAKRLGANCAAVFFSKISYVDVVSEIGIDLALNPRLIAASSLLKFVRTGKVSSVFALRDDSAEVIEIETSEGSPIVGKPLMDIKFPSGALVAGLLHEDSVTIPKGDTVIEPGDRAVIFADRASLPKLEKLLGGKGYFF